MKYFLLRIRYKGEWTPHMTVWDEARYKDWKHRKGHKLADPDAEFIVAKGSRKAMTQLRNKFEGLAKGTPQT